MLRQQKRARLEVESLKSLAATTLREETESNRKIADELERVNENMRRHLERPEPGKKTEELGTQTEEEDTESQRTEEPTDTNTPAKEALAEFLAALSRLGGGSSV